MSVTNQITLALPGVVLLGDEPIILSVYRVNDTPAHRWRYDVCGHDVQIIRSMAVFPCDLFGGGWATNYPSGVVECQNGMSILIVPAAVFIVFMLWLVFKSDGRREASADIMATKGGYHRLIEAELWALKGGKTDRSELDRLELELAEFEKTLEIAPGEGAYLKKKGR